MVSQSRSSSRGRSRTRSQISASDRRISPAPAQSGRSHQESRSPSHPRRSRSYTGSRSRTPPPYNSRNGNRTRSRTESVTRSQSPSRNGGRTYRERGATRSISPEAKRPQSSKIVVEKLTKNVTEAHLQEIFGSYGRIQSVDLPLNRQFMTNRGTAYILYDHPSASESAIAHMHEAQLDGSVITRSLVEPLYLHATDPQQEDLMVDIEVPVEEVDLEQQDEENTRTIVEMEEIFQGLQVLRGGDGDHTHIHARHREHHLGGELYHLEVHPGEGGEVQATVHTAATVAAEVEREADPLVELVRVADGE